MLSQEDHYFLEQEDKFRAEMKRLREEEGRSTAAFEPEVDSVPEKKPRRRKKYRIGTDDDLPF